MDLKIVMKFLALGCLAIILPAVQFYSTHLSMEKLQ
jgi:hypothetical protein